MKKIYHLLAILIASTILGIDAYASIPNNTIVYTSSEGKKCTLNSETPETFGGAHIISHEYSDYTGTIVFDTDLTYLGDAFANTDIFSIDLPESITELGKKAFANCCGMLEITLPRYLKTIGDSCFYNSGFFNIYTSNNITTIGNDAFTGSSMLMNLYVPFNASQFGKTPFASCSDLKYVTVGWETPLTLDPENPLFSGTDLSAATLFVPIGTVELYRNAPVWKDFGTIVENKTPYYSIEYTTTDDQILTLNRPEAFEADILSHTYQNGKGSIVFDIDIETIGETAFFSQPTLKSINIPWRVETIGRSAFESCTALTKINIPSSVATIKDKSFQNCASLEELTLNMGIQHIGSNAFDNCSSLKSVTFPMSVQDIGDYAFNFAGLEEVKFVNGLRTIGSFAFAHNNLTSVEIPQSVQSIAPGAFTTNKKLESIKVANGNSYYNSTDDCNAIIETGRNTLIQGCASTVIPENVPIIGSYAFSSDDITTFDIPEGITTIKENAFYDCKNLTSVNFPASLDSIKPNAFDVCPNIINFTVNPANTTYDSRDNCNAVIETATNTLVLGGTSTVIPNGVTTIGQYAFGYRWRDEDLALTSSVKTIASYAYNNCDSLKYINIPEGIENVETEAFYFCTKATYANIPSTMTIISDNIFSQCNSLTDIYMQSETPAKITDQFATTIPLMSHLTIHVPVGSVELYKSDPNWNKANCITDDQPRSYLYYTTTDGEILIPYNSYFGAYTISNLYNEGQGVFTFENILTQIPAYAFYQCATLKSINFLEGLTKVPNCAFSGCENLEEAIIPSTVTSIGQYAFYECGKLKSFEVPEGVTELPYCSFCYCENLEDIVIPSTVTTFGEYAFYKCGKLKSIYIPEGVKTLSAYLFSECTSLTKVVIPESVDSLGEYTFSTCTSLTDIVLLNETPAKAVSNTFSKVDLSRITLHVPYGTAELYRNAPVWKDFGTINDNATSISDLAQTKSPAKTAIYNLAGQQIIRPLRGQIYIQGGKKYLAR